MQVAAGVEMLQISATMLGKVDVIHPTLLWDEDMVILIDTGYPGQLPLFREAMQKANVDVQRILEIAALLIKGIEEKPPERQLCLRGFFLLLNALNSYATCSVVKKCLTIHPRNVNL